MTARIGVVAGSVRPGSFNRMIAALAVAEARRIGAEVTAIDLLDHTLPLYSHELEATAYPDAAARLKALFVAQDGLIFVTPEHNGSVSALLKNAIDWASRPTGGEGPLDLVAFRGKAAAVMSASPGPFGGMRAITHLRQILGTIQMTVIPEQLIVPFAPTAVSDAGLSNELTANLLNVTVARLAEVAEQIRRD